MNWRGEKSDPLGAKRLPRMIEFCSVSPGERRAQKDHVKSRAKVMTGIVVAPVLPKLPELPVKVR